MYKNPSQENELTYKRQRNSSQSLGSKYMKHFFKKITKKKLHNQEFLYFCQANAYKVFTKCFIGDKLIINCRIYKTLTWQHKHLSTRAFWHITMSSSAAGCTRCWLGSTCPHMFRHVAKLSSAAGCTRCTIAKLLSSASCNCWWLCWCWNTCADKRLCSQVKV